METTETEPRLRLLETTRAYTLERLAESDEWEAVARRHAEYYRNLCERAEAEWETRSSPEWLADYVPEIDNLRAALHWAFLPSGDASIAVALTAAAVPLWLQLSMVEECRSWVERALASLAPAEPTDARGEMKLQAALSASLLFTKGATPEAGQACTTALRLAESLGDTEYQLRALWELWVHRNNTGEYAAALAVAERFYTLALEDLADLPTADRMIGTSYHYRGDQTNAWRHIERMLRPDVDAQPRSRFIRFWFDQKVAGRVVLARILWLRGLADQAWRTLERAVGDAEALADPATLCYALSHGSCLVALWVGNLAAAGRYAEMLLDHSRKHGFGPWGDFASRIKGVVLVKTGDLETGSPLLRAGLDDITDPNSGLWYLTGLTEMAEALFQAGRIADGLATVEGGIDRSQRGWLAPELLRLKGELLLLQSIPATAQPAEYFFRQALDLAGGQGALAVAILIGAREVQIVATGREPLRIEGEHVHRLSPLASPPASTRLTAADALSFPAVQLLVERAAATLDEFELTDSDAPIVADICSKLDGIALAIELAAARVDTFGVRGVAAHLDDRFQLLSRGRRTALPRHRTLRATLDWSYQLLPERERVVLRRVAILAGRFSEQAASSIAASAEIAASEIVESLANLVTKSLVWADVGDLALRYRLLETVRTYALEKLAESGEREQIAERHAEYYLGLFERAEAEAQTRPMDEWLAEYRPRIDNLRAALDWAFSPSGDASIGVALTAASVPLWIDLSMMAECRRHIERALARLTSVAELDPRQEMHLQAALGVSLNYTTGPVPETQAAWTRTLEIAKSLHDTEFQLRALRGLWAHHMNAGEYRASLAIANEFNALATTTGDPAALGAADRMAGIILHYLGDQTGARQHLERRLARAISPVRQSQPVRFLIDQRVAARSLLARILWLQGFPDQAASTAQLAVDEADATGHALSLCHALAQAACPVATLNGDVEAAEGYTVVLLNHARELGLAGWIARSHCFQGVMLIMRRDFAAGLPLLREALDELREGGSAPGYPAFLALFARGLGLAGQVTEGLAVIDQALKLSDRHEENWSLPEVWRNKGELLLLGGPVGTAVAAENCFRQALDWARRDGTLSYELRAAFSLGRLWRDEGRGAEARELVASVYRRFTEGFETGDLRIAKRVLDELNSPNRQ